jgi:hypothetical protein
MYYENIFAFFIFIIVYLTLVVNIKALDKMII